MGTLPANPYDALRDATPSTLVCAAPCELGRARRCDRCVMMGCKALPVRCTLGAQGGGWPPMGVLVAAVFGELAAQATQHRGSLLRLSGTPVSYASRAHTLYLLADDDMPTYKGWTSDCTPPLAPAQPAPPGPCASVTVVPCNNTPPPVEANNPQLLPFAPWDASGAHAPAPPTRRPLRAPFVISDPVAITFTAATLTSVGAGAERALIFSFSVARPGLVRYQLVRNVVDVLGWGMFPVFNPAYAYNVSLSRDCAGVQLVPGTFYGLWYNATDAYGAVTPLRMLSAALV